MSSKVEIMQRAAFVGLIDPFAQAMFRAKLPLRAFPLTFKLGTWAWLTEEGMLELTSNRAGHLMIKPEFETWTWAHAEKCISSRGRGQELKLRERTTDPLGQTDFEQSWLALHSILAASAQRLSLPLSPTARAILYPPH